MLQVLIPCAGSGQRFKDAGYKEPKPLIDVEGQPMLRRVIENVTGTEHTGRYFSFVSQADYKLRRRLSVWFIADFYLMEIRGMTDGAARTCLLVKCGLVPDDPLLICNCDQLVDGGIEPLLNTDADAAVLTMERHNEAKWSYITRFNGMTGNPEVIEEKPVHPHNFYRATTGHYWFRKAGDFFAAAECMIALDDRTNNEFYVAPTLNYLIAARKVVKEVRIESYGGVFHGLGTPEDLNIYLNRKK